MAFLQGLKSQKNSQVCSDQNELKKTALCPTCGSVVEPLPAGAVGAESKFKKRLDMVKKITEDYSR